MAWAPDMHSESFLGSSLLAASAAHPAGQLRCSLRHPASADRRNPESSSLFFSPQVQSFHSPAASGPLLALPKSRQKARHRTRCFAALRARQNPLCFSPAPGCSDSTSVYCFASAAIHRRAPAGIFRRGLRCSAPRTAPLIHESVRPCTTSTNALSDSWLLRQDAPQTGPPVARRGCEGKVRRRAHTMCATSKEKLPARPQGEWKLCT
jgi:hypothetical protein